jgi:hypothetical protein
MAVALPPFPLPLYADLRLVDEHGGEVVLSAHHQKAQRSAHRSVKELAADIKAWVAAWNEDPKPSVWHKTAEQILERLAGYCSAINVGNLSASS